MRTAKTGLSNLRCCSPVKLPPNHRVISLSLPTKSALVPGKQEKRLAAEIISNLVSLKVTSHSPILRMRGSLYIESNGGDGLHHLPPTIEGMGMVCIANIRPGTPLGSILTLVLQQTSHGMTRKMILLHQHYRCLFITVQVPTNQEPFQKLGAQKYLFT